MINLIKYLTIFLLSLTIYSCNSTHEKNVGAPTGPEGPVMLSDDIGDIQASGENQNSSGEHRVVVHEVLNTSRYTYLQVSENDDNFWIAIPRQEVETGSVYYFRGGLLKKNFSSKEFDRVFETLYLVSGIVSESNWMASKPGNGTSSNIPEMSQETEIGTAESQMISLTELFGNPEKYKGKLITVSGKCVKVNAMIMNRNWVHIQDGSGTTQDLTITTTDQIKMGDFVHMEGIISLDKDFGAGYHYEVIMENARRVQAM